jgi:hypothetical protein
MAWTILGKPGAAAGFGRNRHGPAALTGYLLALVR